MKAAVTVKERTIEYREMPEPAPTGPKDVLLKVDYTGICGSDIHVYRGCGHHPGQTKLPKVRNQKSFYRVQKNFYNR